MNSSGCRNNTFSLSTSAPIRHAHAAQTVVVGSSLARFGCGSQRQTLPRDAHCNLALSVFASPCRSKNGQAVSADQYHRPGYGRGTGNCSPLVGRARKARVRYAQPNRSRARYHHRAVETIAAAPEPIDRTTSSPTNQIIKRHRYVQYGFLYQPERRMEHATEPL